MVRRQETGGGKTMANRGESGDGENGGCARKGGIGGRKGGR